MIYSLLEGRSSWNFAYLNCVVVAREISTIKPGSKKIKHFAEYILARVFIFLARILPRRTGLKLFAELGKLAFRLYRRDRERAISNLSMAFPESEPLVIEALAKGCFVALARNAFDAFRLLFVEKSHLQDLCLVEGEEHIDAAYRQGRGVIALTGHIGCWELLAAYFACKGYPVSAVYRRRKNRWLDDLLSRMRKRNGIDPISRGSGSVSAFKALKRGRVLAMLVDQDIDAKGIFVPFFGVPAHTPIGAAAFSVRSGAPIVPMAIHMLPDGTHRITVLPPLERSSRRSTEREAIEELTGKCSQALEKLIRMYPQQWVWFHDRWRRFRELGACVENKKNPTALQESLPRIADSDSSSDRFSSRNLIAENTEALCRI